MFAISERKKSSLQSQNFKTLHLQQKDCRYYFNEFVYARWKILQTSNYFTQISMITFFEYKSLATKTILSILFRIYRLKPRFPNTFTHLDSTLVWIFAVFDLSFWRFGGVYSSAFGNLSAFHVKFSTARAQEFCPLRSPTPSKGMDKFQLIKT